MKIRPIQGLLNEYARDGIYAKIMQALLEGETREAAIAALPIAWASHDLAKLHAKGWGSFCTIVSNELNTQGSSLKSGELASCLISSENLSPDLQLQLRELLLSDNEIIRRTGGLVSSNLEKFGHFGAPLGVTAGESSKASFISS